MPGLRPAQGGKVRTNPAFQTAALQAKTIAVFCALMALAGPCLGLPHNRPEFAGDQITPGPILGPWERREPPTKNGGAAVSLVGPVPEPAPAGTVPRTPGDPPRFDLLLYGGKFNDITFRRIIFRQETDYRPSYVWVVGLNYELGKFIGPVTIETEGQLARHTGLQDNWEANILMIARQEWNLRNRFSFSLAIGDGFSLASEVPRLEREENPRANALLQYLMVEFDFGLPSVEGEPRFMMRVHHRSGVFGLHCAGTCGSNFITYGMKLAF
jgi:hypothetical protein